MVIFSIYLLLYSIGSINKTFSLCSLRMIDQFLLSYLMICNFVVVVESDAV